jgi:hypothetical protein
MKKHKFNIFPEANSEGYIDIKNDIEANGYDEKFPIWLFEGDILDGWQRQKACNELNIKPVYKQFEGTQSEAFHFVISTNTRRSLTQTQRACLAIEADELTEAVKADIEAERRRKQAESLTQTHAEKSNFVCAEQVPHYSTKKPVRAADVIAKMFNTNSKYIYEAKRLKNTAPEKFQQVLSGEKTITEILREKKSERLKIRPANKTKDATDWFFILDKERSCKRPNPEKIQEALQNLKRLGYTVRLEGGSDAK